MANTIYGIKNCDTMKKARAWLDSHGVAYSFHDYKVEGIAKDKLKAWSDKLGWETLLNRAGTTFRKLPDSDKEGLNERKALALMLAQPSMIKRPTALEPVKQTLRTAGWVTKRLPTIAPSPVTTWKTPSGMPASSASSPMRSALSGVSSAGLSTTVLPAASAGAKPQPAMAMGKFHGTMIPTTPSGSWKVTSRPPGTGICRPLCRSGAPA